jgi:hypothetical protein
MIDIQDTTMAENVIKWEIFIHKSNFYPHKWENESTRILPRHQPLARVAAAPPTGPPGP